MSETTSPTGGGIHTTQDRIDICDTLYRYASTIDRFDWEGTRSGLSDDVWAQYGNNDPIVGGDALADGFAKHAPTSSGSTTCSASTTSRSRATGQRRSSTTRRIRRSAPIRTRQVARRPIPQRAPTRGRRLEDRQARAGAAVGRIKSTRPGISHLSGAAGRICDGSDAGRTTRRLGGRAGTPGHSPAFAGPGRGADQSHRRWTLPVGRAHHGVAGGNAPYALPMTLGHENAGVVAALGPGANGVAEGDAVLVYGCWGCEALSALRAGEMNLCERIGERGIGGGLGYDGGLAEYMLVPSTRYLLPIGELDPVQAAPLADAALTPYRAIKARRSALVPGRPRS